MTTTTSTAPPKSRVARVLSRREARVAFLFVLPAFLLFIAFRFGPTIAGVALSFFEYDISGEMAFEGLANFQRMVADPLFWRALGTTVLYTILAVPISLVLSTAMALGVRRAFRGARFFRSIFFLPVITSLVLAGSIFVWIFSGNGPWAKLMAPLGLGGSWLGSTVLVIPAIVIVGVWSRFGYGMMIMIAAMQDIPRELEEAALMDGAGSWQRFRSIILPYLKPTVFFLAVIETTAAFQVFDVIYVMTQGGPAHASYSLVYMLYDQGFKYFDYGYAAAIGVALFVMTLAVALIQRLVIGRQK
ncbi:carbohydrate ABC transporter permease [Microbacterium kyungheense]|uniref:Multiple sugar transport system permease protein n=1 Tax=Microbacterium kyungheense TaxID=1263636 RepID=A0A543EDR1_9MICO|nr:sugar ABC transporter permease [Microbacterium kyungheense]TQM19656.1 multiple sugar transport system permease protein [Microbacterium kyungheense]